LRSGLIVAALTAIACLRIASTYTIFSQTADEPAHVAAGMELLVQHRYTLHIDNTPLPRIIIALPAWLAGRGDRFAGNIVEQGNSVLDSKGHYRTNLVLVRLPNLLFFLIAVIALWLWTREMLGDSPAVLAVLLFTTQPVILGHAGLATTDMAATAGVAVALLGCWRFFEMPSALPAVIAGAAYGFAINCKLSAIVFVPAAVVAMLIVRLIRRRQAAALQGASRWLLFGAATVVVCWAGYGFTVGTIDSVEPVPATLLPALNGIFARWIVPAPHLFRGALKLLEQDRRGVPAYLFGMSDMHGWWWYFPAALALKTALATLIAAIIGARGRALEAAAAALAMLGWAMTTHTNYGIRHLLPIYVPLSVVAAAGIWSLLRSHRAMAIVLLAWQIGAGVFAHPDYFPYFNETAGRDPSRYLLDSNLDWGQDLLRLEHELRRRNIQQFGFKYFGSADLSRQHLPPWTELAMNRPTKGWVAISEMFYRGVWYDGYHANRYPWLADEKPVARVGKSIRLYFIR
jgi:dolichyl-phosphate-mannose-protein mannosyltransferase